MESGRTPSGDELLRELDAMIVELHGLVDTWKERAMSAEDKYRYWRNRAERAERALGRVPPVPFDDP
jgi:hypothetical protein